MKNILDKENRTLRKSFSALAEKTFGISFEEWYRNGYWGDNYLPYCFSEGGRVISAAAANIMTLSLDGECRKYIQIGTVMTDEAYRGRGLSRRLLNEIICDWKENCSGIYLFANSSVLDFYPRFGFAPEEEFVYSTSTAPLSGDFRRMDMLSAADRGILRDCYARSNPFSALGFKNSFGLLMFYCSSFLKNCVYYSERFNAAAIAEYEGRSLICHDIFGGEKAKLKDILNALADETSERAVLGFAPKSPQGFDITSLESDDYLFVLKGGNNPLCGRRLRLPSLSHA